ncbi:hypothetical protein FIBSPDRAFT_1052879 [Athelia psychrophila]|uniref:Uncharacterized protein n=1 Tax=Athelia psychrophila TaxID=1759441 RepID=A0A165WFH6_9AGAM|nr:hypothetical protein FIBSPDRAFT_1052879 [Fibularhizoctonia sp. CBS 109695]
MLLPRAVERLGRRVAQNSTYSESRQAMTQVPDLLASTRCRLVRTFVDSETSLNARLYTQTDGLQLSVSVMYDDTGASSDTRAPIIESTSGPNLQGLESPLAKRGLWTSVKREHFRRKNGKLSGMVFKWLEHSNNRPLTLQYQPTLEDIEIPEINSDSEDEEENRPGKVE